ncbi:MAG: DUF357 domain-containing protein [Candidatus Micrarchaeia archaeon]
MAGRSERQRVLSDIEEFEESASRVETGTEGEAVLELARRYARDARYFLEKGDAFTAWGCINYAHGLIDALRDLRSRQKPG